MDIRYVCSNHFQCILAPLFPSVSNVIFWLPPPLLPHKALRNVLTSNSQNIGQSMGEGKSRVSFCTFSTYPFGHAILHSAKLQCFQLQLRASFFIPCFNCVQNGHLYLVILQNKTILAYFQKISFGFQILFNNSEISLKIPPSSSSCQSHMKTNR